MSGYKYPATALVSSGGVRDIVAVELKALQSNEQAKGKRRNSGKLEGTKLHPLKWKELVVTSMDFLFQGS